MRFGGSRGFWVLLLFLVLGAILGGILGQMLKQASLSGMVPYLTQTYEIFDLQNIHLDLAVVQLDLGVRFAPNLISIIGIIAAGWIFHKV